MATKKTKAAAKSTKAAKATPAENKAETLVMATVKPETSAEALVAVGQRSMKSNPDIDEVFVTADGQAFRLESDAKNHAANLKVQDIVKVSRN